MVADKGATVPESQRAPGMVFALLQAQAARFGAQPLFLLPQAVAELWQLPQAEWSYAQVLAAADDLAGGYRAAGYGPGHRVALLLENRPAHFLHWLALNAVGASVLPVNPDYTTDELAYVLGHGEAALLVHLQARAAQAKDAAAQTGTPLMPEDGMPPPVTPAADSPPSSPGAAECALVYTSGTTGRPKGCLLSDAYFRGWADWYCAQGGLIALRQGQERLLTPLPTFHVNAMGNSFMGMLASGGAQVIVDRFHPRTWWAAARETGATCFHYLGVMPAILLALPEEAGDRDHCLRFGMGGGVHPDHHAAFEARFRVPLLEGWAMTETGGGGILCAAAEPRHVGSRCLGRPDRPGPPLEIRLADDDGAAVAAGEPGELLVRAAGPDPRHRFFSGYLKDPAATEAAWAGGWLHTGDIMRQAPDGSLHFVDRKKNIIRRSGENIAAIEVEAVLAAHPEVAQAAVVAVPDPMRDEEVMALVVPAAGAAPDAALAARILEHCAARLAYYKLPGYVGFADALPTTSTQKVRKADLGSLADLSVPDAARFDLRDAKQAKRGGPR